MTQQASLPLGIRFTKAKTLAKEDENKPLKISHLKISLKENFDGCLLFPQLKILCISRFAAK
jgi:hypothetical protein